MKGVIGKVGKTNLAKNLGDKHAMNRNPEQIMGKLQNMIDPKMMAQLGGAGNLMGMMKEMANNPQMEEMMKGMGGIEGMAKKKYVKAKK